MSIPNLFRLSYFHMQSRIFNILAYKRLLCGLTIANVIAPWIAKLNQVYNKSLRPTRLVYLMIGIKCLDISQTAKMRT